MDVNGTRFKLLLGCEDWAACTDDGGHSYDLLWRSTVPSGKPLLAWDRTADELTLLPEVFEFPAGRLDRRPRLVDRRGAGADVYGNWYWIGPDARTILVEFAGDGSTAQFWPGHGDCPPAPLRIGAFGPVEPVPAPAPATAYAGAAVTVDHFLVVGTIDPPGLLVFDLLTGGPPSALPWPPDAAFRPFDIARRPGGGVFVLDTGTEYRVWELDRSFHVVPAAQPPPESPPGGSFEPVGGAGGVAPSTRMAAIEATQVEGDPMAVEALPDGGFLLLDRNELGGHSLVWQYADGVAIGTPAPIADTLSGLEVVGHDMAVAGDTLFVVDRSGNQAYAFTLTLGDDGPALDLVPSYYPMRLFGGKGLVTAPAAKAGMLRQPEYGPCEQALAAPSASQREQPWYDFGDGWIPLVAQPRSRYVESGAAVTPVLDGGEPGCVWHRLTIDAIMPPETSLAVSTIAADDENALGLAEWSPEPTPIARRTGVEVPFVDLGTYQTFELLFQHAVGRYLQIRLELEGDGRASPRVRAMRAWFPRFSYLRQYLPGVYRQDPDSSSFLDRYLANVEGMSTALEDTIAAAQVLMRPQTVPADWLDWLASWFDLALDPMWDDARRRLFLANAMQFFAARGTMRGVEIALRLALDRCVDGSVYKDTRPPALATARIVESFRTRKTPGVVFGDPTDLEPLRLVTTAAVWRPDQGGEALAAGYAAFLDSQGLASAPYPIADPRGPESTAWQQFSQAALGYVPVIADAASWQAFLSRRYASPGAVATAYKLGGGAPVDFAGFKPPLTLPADGPALLDWFQFQSVVLPMRRKAHRFTVLLPWPMHVVDRSGTELDHVRLQDLATRIVDVQKPAHTLFDVKFFWAAFRIGEARLGDDTLLASGSRVPELVEPAVLGRDYVGTATLAGPIAGDEIVREPPAPSPTPATDTAEEAP
jgi:phage tail-like protein